MKPFKKYYKKFLVMLLSLGIMLTLSSCVPTTATLAIFQAFESRIQANKDIINRLEAQHILDEATAKDARKRLDDTLSNIENALDDENKLDNLFKHISAWRDVTIDDYGEYHNLACYTDEETGREIHWWEQVPANWYNDYFTSYVHKAGSRYESYVSPIKATPLELINKELQEKFNSAMAYHVCVLNKDAKDANGNPVTMETIMKELQNLDITDAKAVTAIKNKYFVDTKAPVIDTSLKENQLVQVTKTDYTPVMYHTNLMDKQQSGCRTPGIWFKPLLDQEIDKPGYDLCVNQNGYLVMKIRLQEFNYDAYQNILSQLGNNDKYIYMGDGSGSGFALLLEYPVGTISGFDLDKSTMQFKPRISVSKLSINIRTGEIIKNNKEPVCITNGFVSNTMDRKSLTINSKDPYLVTSLGMADSSSFAFYGETGASGKAGDWNLAFGDTNIYKEPISVPRIVLMDYLELTYNPGIISNEDLVAYGRKIRFDSTKLEGKIDSKRVPVAWYCEINGVKPDASEESRWVCIDQIGDKTAIRSETPYIKRFPINKQEGFGEITQAESTEKPINIEMLKTEIADNILTTFEFPSSSVDNTADFRDLLNDGNDLTLFYSMFIRTPMVESGLLNWMTSTNDQSSLKWWTEWLNSHGYEYGNLLQLNAVMDFLKNNYSYELAKTGLVLLDLDTIAKINEEFTHQDNVGRTSFIRTIFKVLGYALIWYAVILMLCWAFDVNIDLGLDLLGKASFNQLVAVSSTEEIPQTSEKAIKYVQFKDIIIQALKITAIGILFITVDILTIVKALIHFLGGLASVITMPFGG